MAGSVLSGCEAIGQPDGFMDGHDMVRWIPVSWTGPLPGGRQWQALFPKVNAKHIPSFDSLAKTVSAGWQGTARATVAMARNRNDRDIFTKMY
jgi:hypothetical protein